MTNLRRFLNHATKCRRDCEPSPPALIPIGSHGGFASRPAGIAQHGAPEYLRSDNGSEFIARIVQRWLKEQQIRTIYIEPGRPWQNGFVESFHGRFRDECLNREQLWTLMEARVVVGDYRRKDNQIRPHSRLGYESPVAFAARHCPSLVPVGLRPPSTQDGQTGQRTTSSNQCPD